MTLFYLQSFNTGNFLHPLPDIQTHYPAAGFCSGSPTVKPSAIKDPFMNITNFHFASF